MAYSSLADFEGDGDSIVAGHSRWKNIKHRKAASDAKRGKIWSKCVKAVMVAAKTGGADPVSNLALRYAIDEARYANVPRDTIDRAVKKGAGEVGGDDWETVRYEGYGPGGVALVVDALTNNRTRTVGDLRLIFGRHGGNLGASGCVAFMFQTRGVIVVRGSASDETRVMEAAVDAGAVDVLPPDDDEESWTILTESTDLAAAKESIERSGLSIERAGLDLIPETRVRVDGESAERLADLVEALDDNDDVQRVSTNAEVADGDSGL